MFKYKTEAELTAMTPAERDTYAVDKRKFEQESTQKMIADAIKAAFPDKTADQIKAEADALKKEKDEKDLFKKEFDEVKETVNQIKENTRKVDEKPDAILVYDAKGKKYETLTQKDNFEKIKASIMVKGPQEHEFIVKADTLRSSVVGNPAALDLPDIGQLATKKLTMYDVFPKVPVSRDQNGTVRYVDWDADTISRAAAMLAEGDTFPNSTAKWATYTMELKKVGDRIPMSEEFMYDDARFGAELEGFLRTNIAIVLNDELTNGVGTTTHVKGLLTYAPTWTPTGAGVEAPTIYDLLVVMKTAITKLYGSKYNPDVAFMNDTDIDAYKLAKDANENYIMPPFVGQNGTVIDGMVVISNNDVAQNTLVIGDRRYARIYEEPGIVVATGYNGTDFEEDMMTLKARRRLNLLVRKADETGWLKCTNITTALTTIDNPIS